MAPALEPPVLRPPGESGSPPRREPRLLGVQSGGADPLTDALAVLACGSATLIAVGTLGAARGLQGMLTATVPIRDLLATLAVGALWPALYWGLGGYRERAAQESTRERLLMVAAGTLLTVLAIPTATWLTRRAPAAEETIIFWGAVLAGPLAVRAFRRSGPQRHRVLIVGNGPRGRQLWRSLAQTPGFELVGFVDILGARPIDEEVARRSIGTLDQLESLLMHQEVDEVDITLPIKSHYADIAQAILVAERVGVKIRYGADLFACQLAWPTFDRGNASTVTLHVVPDDHRLTVKRAVDLAGATVMLMLLAPVLLLVALAIKATSRGPVLFAQERLGLNRRRFQMLKFRTMVADAEHLQAGLEVKNEAQGPVFKIAADPRVTPIGRFLRRTSLDELPQFVNVLRGEMSLVGPRPLPVRDVKRFTRSSDMRRFSVRPGLTCLWQIGGRCNLTFREWVRLDLAYIDQWSLGLDLKILLRTPLAVLRGDGAR